MNILKLFIQKKAMFVLVIAAIAASCARKITFATSTVVPAATGKVKITKDQNKNNKIGIDIKNLAEAKRLTPSKNAYVVWMETDHTQAKSLGRLNTSSGFLSGALKASLNTVTPLKPRRIYITAEDDPMTQYPGTQVVMTTDRF